MSKIYLKCHHCKKLHPIDTMEINQEYDDIEEIEDKNITCKQCFNNSQDNLAYNESNGEFTNYEDWMESRGATICDTEYHGREE